ncbi:hypothetical protein [Flavobacterium algicola]|uniref:hypothetical protein n=1 Tax=Flavobacterium algicola TaxID=556529 RepID=UPI001EFC62BA|nr:hypothetical protein [Flavobacterium algicola]MCG9793879.1 hypothetical protein [Flavobacterium algicola]
MIVTVLNIPNFYASYYLLGFSQVYKLKYKPENRFQKYNNKPITILEIKGVIVIIDNDDPVGVVQELYDLCSWYFVTNKLKNHPSYAQEKVKPLFPHYPVAICSLYVSLFGMKLFRYLKFKEVVRQLYIQWRRPSYENKKFKNVTSRFVFFSSNIWKKEANTNTIRAEFIRFCKQDARIKFEGGFVPRSDNNNLGFDEEVNKIMYSPRIFSKRSAQSLIALNNPAVCDAVSWRLAEYLNQGLFVLSFPFKIELPVEFKHQQNIHFIEETRDYKDVLDRILDEVGYHEKIASEGKKYFDTHCTPQAQIHYIMREIAKF